MNTVPVVADLSSARVGHGDLVTTAGYLVVGDGGGNVYRYDEASTATADGWSVVTGPGSAGRYFLVRDTLVTGTRTLTNGDATPSVAGMSSLRTGNSAPLTITDLDDGAEGQVVVVILDENTTVEHNANISLNGAIDYFPEVADATIALIFENSVWKEIGRSVPSSTVINLDGQPMALRNVPDAETTPSTDLVSLLIFNYTTEVTIFDFAGGQLGQRVNIKNVALDNLNIDTGTGIDCLNNIALVMPTNSTAEFIKDAEGHWMQIGPLIQL